MINDLFIPTEWLPTSDWNSHRLLLYIALEQSQANSVVEFGCGDGSTPLLYKYCSMNEVWQFMSYETNPVYAAKFEQTTRIVDYNEPFAAWQKTGKVGLLFIDCAPGEIRKDLVDLYANMAKIIVVHDTEPGAEYVYGMSAVLKSFKYRCDCIIDGMPQTTAVSNTFDFKDWAGDYNGFKLVSYESPRNS